MKTASLLIMLLATALHVSGCSLLGLCLGSLDNRIKPGHIIRAAGEIGSIKEGDVIQVISRDSSTVTGEFAGVWRRDEAAYSREYGYFREMNMRNRDLPELGRVTITVKQSGNLLHLNLIGFDYLTIPCRKEPGGEILEIDYNQITTIVDGNGANHNAEKLRQMAANGEMPLLSRLSLQTSEGLQEIPLADIAEIYLPVSKNGKLIGFAVGASIDVIVIIALAASNFPFGDEPLFE